MPFCLFSWPRFWSKRSRINFWCLSICLFIWAGTPVFAQDAANTSAPISAATIILNDKTVVYDISASAYHTRDGEGDLSSREIFLRHQNNLRGEHLIAGPLNFSFDPVPHWMLVDVRNDSHRSDWFLDLGRLTEGRTGLASRFFVQNGQSGNLLFNGLQPGGFKNFDTGMAPTILPLNILPGQFVTLLIYTIPSDHAPYVLTPKIISSEIALNDTANQSELWIKRIALTLSIGSAIFFLGCLMLRRGVGFFPHVLFCINQAFWFWLSGDYVFAGIPGGTDLQGITMATGALLALAATQSLVISQEDDGADSIFLYICASLVLVTIVVFTFLLPDGSDLRMKFILSATALGYMVSALKALTIKNDMRWAGIGLGFAWVLQLTALSLPYLCAMGRLPFTPDYIAAPWLAAPIVCLFLILSAAAYFRATNLSLVREILRQTQRIQKQNNLRQTRESADQARLLRVIEREREIMGDLRARETERAEEMRIAKISADEANRAKSAFLAVVSHEIRTPMTGIMGMVRLLMDTNLSREQRDFSQTIQDSGDSMLALLNDILDFSKIEGGGLDLESIDFDLHRVIKSVAMLMNGHATQRGIYLETAIDPDAPRYLKGDPTRIRQVLLNLVGNAIKFTPHGGVTIRLMTGDPDSATGEKLDYLPVVLAVEDTGIGISEEAQQNLFNPFSQADSSIARKFGGTGLGLAICKRLIEAMGGETILTSVVSKGTTFQFTILLPPGDQKKADDEGHTHDPVISTNIAKPMDLLVVDDNAINRKVMEGLLGRDGHRVTSVASGQDALHILGEREFDLVFMDIEMPGMNGIETLKHILASPQADIPVVALTGNVSAEDGNAYLTAGMRAILPKPIDPEHLRNILLNFGKLKLGNNFEVVAHKAPISWTLSDADLEEDSFAGSVEYAQNRPQQTDDVEEDAPEATTDAATPEAPKYDAQIFDEAIFNSLVTSLGADQLRDMLDGVFEHNKTVLPLMQAAFNEGDNDTLRARAHELKGMNGNFGLKGIAKVAAVIELGCTSGNLSYDQMDEQVLIELPKVMADTETAYKKPDSDESRA